MRRILVFVVLALTIAGLAGCTRKKVKNPLANLGSKQPDKVLFDNAMGFMKKGRWDQSRLLLQTLINTYPDSEYIARAKLGVADSWYNEGGTAAMTQAENEYRDFITFFPNMTEASEAQMKIANIHFREMEKSDRDFTHAKRAEEEYRTMLTQYPDSPLVPQAKERLLQVQEVLAEREFLIGRFYYMRGSYPASEARLETLVNTYPLYSGSDEALMMLADCYEKQADNIRRLPLTKTFDEVKKAELLNTYTDKAAAAYDRIVTRYAATDRVGDAKARLEALRRPVPTPTAEDIARSKAEEASREELGRFARARDVLHKNPGVTMAEASKVGDPTLTDPKEASAPAIIKRETNDLTAAVSGRPLPSLEEAKEAEAAKKAADAAAAADANTQPPPAPTGAGIQELNTLPPAAASTGDNGHVEAQTGGNATPGENQPPPTTQAPPPAPPQVNEASPDQASTSAQKPEDNAKAADKSKQDEKDNSSSSKSKKKKGLKKLIPF
ncbi:MAG: outer membrane protein assembly factor BamD [Terriglobales bacterium]